MQINTDETQIKSTWIFDGKKIIVDEQGKRLMWLQTHYLLLIATNISRWEKLYKDPKDGRFWELTFPHGEMQGGGPELLQCISANEAIKKYNV